jgi:hypothetical protein
VINQPLLQNVNCFQLPVWERLKNIGTHQDLMNQPSVSSCGNQSSKNANAGLRVLTQVKHPEFKCKYYQKKKKSKHKR